MLFNTIRYDEKSLSHLELNVNGKFFESYFCDDCGNYLYLDNNNYIKNILCFCDRIPKIYKFFIYR